MFNMISALFPILFAVVLGIIIFRALTGMKEWHDNNQQPVLTVTALIVSKRTHVSRSVHNHGEGHIHHHTDTTYYITFQVDSGDRMEFKVSGREYGILAEGDEGSLTFQGTRYHEFSRY